MQKSSYPILPMPSASQMLPRPLFPPPLGLLLSLPLITQATKSAAAATQFLQSVQLELESASQPSNLASTPQSLTSRADSSVENVNQPSPPPFMTSGTSTTATSAHSAANSTAKVLSSANAPPSRKRSPPADTAAATQSSTTEPRSKKSRTHALSSGEPSPEPAPSQQTY